MDMKQIATAVAGFGTAFDGFKSRNDAALAALIERLETLEAGGDRPTRASNSPKSAAAREHKTRFNALRKPTDAGSAAALSEFEAREFKNITIGTPSAGGYAVPEEIGREIERMEMQFSPVRSLVKVQQVGTSDYKELVSLRGATSGWVAETGTRSATDTSALRERVPTHGELYAYPQASEWSLDDVFFNVEQWVAEECAQAFAVEEGDAVIRGDGSSKPTGMLNTSPTSAADFASPLRAAGAYQYVACPSDESPAVAEILADKLIDLVYSVNSAYRAGASWAMNSQTAGAVAKLKNGQGDYIWRESLISGQPAQLLGYPVAIWEQMDDIGSNAHPIAFGNFRRAYTLTDRHDIRITVDRSITAPGFVKFYVRKRVGGIVTNNDALKFLKTTLS